MQFKLVKTGKSYADPRQEIPSIRTMDFAQSVEETVGIEPEDNTLIAERGTVVLPIIWETGNMTQIRSLLVLREAELVVVKAQLTGVPHQDWYAQNRILDLEIKIADLKRWLAEAMEKGDGS